MNEESFAYVALIVSGLIAGYASIGRLLRLHQPIPWMSGGHLTLVGEIALSGFVGCVGLFVLVSRLFFIPALIFWVIASRAQTIARRDLQKKTGKT